MSCYGCGKPQHDLPWGYCPECTAALIDSERTPVYRVEDPVWLERQLDVIRRYDEVRA